MQVESRLVRRANRTMLAALVSFGLGASLADSGSVLIPLSLVILSFILAVLTRRMWVRVEALTGRNDMTGKSNEYR